VDAEESIAYLGLSFAELVDRVGEQEAWRLYRAQGRQAFLPKAALMRAIGRVRPDVVVATNSPRAERAAIEAAKELGVPSLCIVDLFAIFGIDWIGRSGYADRVCVLSDYVRKKFIAAGRKHEDVVVTGNPAFDRLACPDLPRLAKELRHRMGWEGRKVVLYAGHVEPTVDPLSGAPGNVTLPGQVESLLCDMSTRRPDLAVVIRPHPSEARNADTVPVQLHFSGRSDNYPVLLRAADAVVTFSSTVGLEAALLHIPVLAVEGAVLNYHMPLAEAGLATAVLTLQELPTLLDMVLSGGKRPIAGLPEFGTATPKVAEEILKVMSLKRCSC
jgi:UDP-N-acetylglucosamine:LPS N-acetylglucosamine transferase